MKKLTLIGTVVLLVSLMTVAFASADDITATPTDAPAGIHFVDEDGDGVCDLCGGLMGQNGWQGNGQGINFVDEDGDGVCDNCGTMNQYSRRLNGQGRMMGSLTGQPGLNFIDEDGDGVCDLMGQGSGQQGMQFRGRGQARSANAVQP